MSITTTGLHHVTAMAGRAQAAIEYYVRFLGMRLVKRTVNFDDPLTYHLYFGDAQGNPGSVVSLFPWPGAGPAERGTSESTAVSLRVPVGALDYWRSTLELHEQPFESRSRFGSEAISFTDPDGVPLELVEGAEPPAPPPTAETAAVAEGSEGPPLFDILRTSRYWPGSPIASEAAIMGLDAVTLTVWDRDATVATLVDVLGFSVVSEEEGRLRLSVGDATQGLGSRVDVVGSDERVPSRLGTGSLHHVAFRVADQSGLEEAREQLLAAGLHPTTVKDRHYFRSVYFRDPTGVILELATDGPGFSVDESLDELGLAFKLPSWLEPERQFFRARLPVTASPEYADRYGIP